MNYTELTIEISQDSLDPLLSALLDMETAGFEVEDPEDIKELQEKKNDYEWDYIDPLVLSQAERNPRIRFYFSDDPEGLEALDNILQEIQIFPVIKAEIRGVSDGDWKDNWKAWFKPKKITERMVIKPSWEAYEPSGDEELIIEIDPGMAFGTGTHATTTLCVKLMETYLLPGRDQVLDIGSGSGILSIAAALLGAKEVRGVEIDPVAVQVGRENVRLNRLMDIVEIAEGDLTKGLDYKAHLVVANLMADLVISLSGNIAKHLHENGIFISSGILVEKQKEVSSAIKAAGFELLEIRQDGDWCAMAARAIPVREGTR